MKRIATIHPAPHHLHTPGSPKPSASPRNDTLARRKRPLRGACALLLLTAACDPSVFDDLQDSAPVVIIERPGDFAFGAFGKNVQAYQGMLQGLPVSRYAMSSGPGTGVLINQGWTGTGVALEKSAMTMCVDVGDCDGSHGRTMLALPNFDDEQMCFVVAGPESATRVNAEMIISCETNAVSNLILPGPNEVAFASAGAALPAQVSSIAVAVFGAPGQNGNDGALYLLPDAVVAPELLVLSDPSAVDTLTGAFGSAVAAAAWDADTAVVAATAPISNLVVVGFLDDTSSNLQVQACVGGDSSWTPMQIGLADINAESSSVASLVDLIVSVDTNGDDVVDQIEIYDGANLETNAGCTAPATSPLVLTCPEDDTEFACAGSLFGASFSVGDVDGDGIGDLIVGAPGAAANDKLLSGAVLIFAGVNRDTDNSLSLAQAAVLQHPSPGFGDGFGSSVAALPSGLPDQERAEIVVGSPGAASDAGEVTVFLCSPLVGDRSGDPGVNERCLPK